MIGAFARMLGSRDRILTVEQTGENGYEVKTRTPTGEHEASTSQDAPPEAFTEKIPHEGGDVFLAPVLETLRRVITSRFQEAKTKETLSRVSEKP